MPYTHINRPLRLVRTIIPLRGACYTKVVRLVTTALKAVRLAEQRWMQAADALKRRRYSLASQLMGDAKRSISDATKG